MLEPDPRAPAEFMRRVRKGIKDPEIVRSQLKHLPFKAPPPWMATLLLRAMDGEARRDPILALGPHGKPPNVGLGYLGDLTDGLDGRHKHISVYWTDDADQRTRFVPREAALSVAAAALLVLDFGYDVTAIELEASDHAFDVMAYAKPGSREVVLLAVEAKVEDSDLNKLVVGMRRCRGLGTKEMHRDACRAANLTGSADWENHHRKCRGILRHRPLAFWPVSYVQPDRYAFAVRTDGTEFDLDSVPLETLARAVLAHSQER